MSETITKEFLKGMRWKDILKLDPDIVGRFDEGAYKTAVKRLSKYANRNLYEFMALNMESPATKWAERSGGVFSAKGKKINQLSHEFKRAREFLTSQTATVKGYRELKGEIATKLLKEDIEITEEDYEKFWKSYERLKEINPAVKEKALKYKVLKYISYMVQSDRRHSAHTIAENISKRLEDIERENENDTGNDYGVSQFFSKPV